MARPVHQRPGERGFALLIVFVMAAVISIGLYMELPRSVFESQRAKEETLFDRGEQYKMGIKRYYTKFQRYPNTIEELEQTNGTRYLRRRYKDPFTGKDDWKILKFGPNGLIEGSVHNKKKTGLDNDKDPKQSTGSVVAGPSLGDLNPGEDGSMGGVNGQDKNPALNRRPSDTGIGAQLAGGTPGGVPGGVPGPPGQNSGQYPNGQFPGAQNQGGQYPGGQGGQYQGAQNQNGQYQNGQYQGGQYPPQTQAGQNPGQQNQGQYSGAPNFGGLSGPGTPNPNIPQYQNGSFTGPQQNSGNPGPLTQQQLLQQQYFQQQSGQLNRLPGAGGTPFPGLPGQPANSQGGGQIGVPFGGQPNSGQLNGGQNPALQMINQLLTSPRQGGVQVGQLSGGALGGAMPTGIAGVVSKHKGQGIKVLDERTKIHEWEFIYDVRKDKSLQKGGMGMQQSGSLPGSGLSNSSGFGQSPSNGSGFGQGNGFGGSNNGSSNNGSNNGIGGAQNRRQ